MRIHKLAFLLITLDFNSYIKVKKILLRKRFKVLGFFFRKGKLPTLLPINKEVEFRKKNQHILGMFS